MEHWKNICDGSILCFLLSAVFGHLSGIAAFLAIILSVMRIVIEWSAFKAKVKAKFAEWFAK